MEEAAGGKLGHLTIRHRGGQYDFDGNSSIYRVLVETPLDDSPSAGLQAAHKILTEHTVLNDGDR